VLRTDLDFEEPGRVDEDAGERDPHHVEAELAVARVHVGVADAEEALGRDGEARVRGA
jgi:hypothetical protein